MEASPLGCNCGRGANGKKLVFIATDKKGQQKTFKTEIEARAYLARNGGGAVMKRELTGVA